MHLILEFEKNGQKWQINNLPGTYEFDFENRVNLGCEIDMDGDSISQFLSVRGTLTSDRYPQSDITKPISFFLDSKTLVLNLTFKGASDYILDKSSIVFSSIIGSSEPIEFIIRKFVQKGSGGFEPTVYSFNGVIKSITRTFLGDADYTYTVALEIEMIEPRFSKLEYNLAGDLVSKFYSIAPTVQGIDFAIEVPLTFGSDTDTLEIVNGGNSPVVPTVTLRNSMSNIRIVTPSGTFEINTSIQDGQILTIDVENISAKLDEIELNSLCTGWEFLTLETGINSWSVQGNTFSASSLITVEFFEKYQSL